MVQRLKTKDWGHGILTEQDQGFIYAQNALTNIMIKYRIGDDGNFGTIAEYLDNYCCPDGFKDRLELWDDFEEFLHDEGLLGLIDE